MRCTEARPLFPLYLDSAVTGVEMHAISEHMKDCGDCRTEYKKLENTRLLVSQLGRRPVPPNLGLKIKLAISHERSRNWRSILRAYAVRLENTMNAFTVPATAGLLTAVIFFGTLIGCFRLPQQSADDVVPAALSNLPARLIINKQAPIDDSGLNDDLTTPLLVQVYVDASGKVQNYSIVSGPDNASVRSELNRKLLFTNFDPAYEFGQPVPSTTVMSFFKVNVRG